MATATRTKIVTAPELAKVLRVSPRTLRRMVDRGVLHPLPGFDRAVRFDLAAALEDVTQGQVA